MKLKTNIHSKCGTMVFKAPNFFFFYFSRFCVCVCVWGGWGGEGGAQLFNKNGHDLKKKSEILLTQTIIFNRHFI